MTKSEKRQQRWEPVGPDCLEDNKGYLYDDFRDGELHQRDRNVEPRRELSKEYPIFRPVWTIVEGDPRVEDSVLIFQGDSRRHVVNRFSHWSAGSWKISIESEADRIGGCFNIYPLMTGIRIPDPFGKLPVLSQNTWMSLFDRCPKLEVGADFWRIRIEEDHLYLEKKQNGKIKTVASSLVATGGRSDTLEVTKSSDGKWNVFVNGDRKFDTKQEFSPSPAAFTLEAVGLESSLRVSEVIALDR